MKVRFRRLTADAVLPSYAKVGDAGLDLTATTKEIPLDHEGTVFQREKGYVVYGTGIAVEIPEGYVGLIFPRSSIFKKGMVLTNCVGVIDSGYRGEIKFMFRRINGAVIEDYEVGDRIGQMIIVPFPTIEVEEATELSASERGTGGFGSTGA